MNIITKSNYIYFTTLSVFVWAILVLYTIFIKQYNINNDILMYYLSLISTFTMAGISYIYREKIKQSIAEKLKSEQKEHNLKFNIKEFLSWVAAGSIAFFLYRYIYYYGLQETNAIIANSLNYSWVIFSVVLSAYMNKNEEKLDTYTKYILTFGLLGVLFIFDIFSTDIKFELIYLIILIASFFASLDLNILSKIKDKFINNIYFVYMFYFMIIFIFMNIYVYISNIDVTINLLQFFLLVCFSLMFLLASSTYMVSFNVGNKVVVSYFGYLIPVLTTLGLIIFFNYKWTISTIIGTLLLVMTGVFLNKRVKAKIIGIVTQNKSHVK